MKEDPTVHAAHDADDIRRGAVLMIDVRTEGGEKLMQLIEAQLAERMLQIANDDPYCMALLEVLRSVGYNIALAADKSARLMAQQAVNG
jgi:hypothetical protein